MRPCTERETPTPAPDGVTWNCRWRAAPAPGAALTTRARFNIGGSCCGCGGCGGCCGCGGCGGGCGCGGCCCCGGCCSNRWTAKTCCAACRSRSSGRAGCSSINGEPGEMSSYTGSMASWRWTRLQWRTKSARRSRLNCFWHKLHWKHPDPGWCVRWCLFRLALLVKVFPHWAHTKVRPGPALILEGGKRRMIHADVRTTLRTIIQSERDSAPLANQGATPHRTVTSLVVITCITRATYVPPKATLWRHNDIQAPEGLQGSAHKTDSNKSYKLWISMSKNQSRSIINCYFFKWYLHARNSWLLSIQFRKVRNYVMTLHYSSFLSF